MLRNLIVVLIALLLAAIVIRAAIIPAPILTPLRPPTATATDREKK